MTASISLVMPDFRAVSDEDLESLLPQADGAWSRQTRALMLGLGAQKLNLNSNWAEVRRDWVCEACQRRKPEIARVSDHGVLLCQLEWHHDHLRDHAKKMLRPLVNIEDRTPEGRDLRRGVDACTRPDVGPASPRGATGAGRRKPLSDTRHRFGAFGSSRRFRRFAPSQADRLACGSAWKRDPVSGVIGVE